MWLIFLFLKEFGYLIFLYLLYNFLLFLWQNKTYLLTYGLTCDNSDDCFSLLGLRSKTLSLLVKYNARFDIYKTLWQGLKTEAT